MHDNTIKHLSDSWFKTDINGDEWTIYLAADEDDVIADKDAAAETDFEAREIYVRREFITRNVLCHELFHAYFGYTYLGDTTEVTVGDFEEIAAGLFADRAEKILDKANECEIRLNELKRQLHGK